MINAWDLCEILIKYKCAMNLIVAITPVLYLEPSQRHARCRDKDLRYVPTCHKSWDDVWTRDRAEVRSLTF